MAALMQCSYDTLYHSRRNDRDREYECDSGVIFNKSCQPFIKRLLTVAATAHQQDCNDENVKKYMVRRVFQVLLAILVQKQFHEFLGLLLTAKTCTLC